MTALFLYTELMIRILLILVTFISFSAKADMDEICLVNAEQVGYAQNEVSYVFQIIKDRKCVRNNILTVLALSKGQATNIIGLFCRYDREVNYIYLEDGLGKLTCVLYSNNPRSFR